MSPGENRGTEQQKGIESGRKLLDQWTGSLAQVLESMTDQKPDVRWEAGSGPSAEGAGAEAEILWWEQPFLAAPEGAAWVATPRAVWELAGTLTLKAAGLDTGDAAEIRNTWLEILGQSLSALARSVGSLVGHEVTCGAGVERAPANPLTGWASVQLTFPEAPLPPLWIAFSPQLLSLISEPRASADAEPPDNVTPAAQETAGDDPNPYPRTLDLLLDVDLPVSISFGKAQLPMKDVLKLTTGSIVELNRGVNEPVEVLVNHCLIARGEVVVVEGNYGVRIQEIVSRHERLRSLR